MELISEEYRKAQQEMHLNANYGVASVSYAPLVAMVLDISNAGELLDYGAGKGRLGGALSTLVCRPLNIRLYEPAVPEWAAQPVPSKVVACIDVLEHIEPNFLDNVLDDLQRLTLDIGVFTVHTGPAAKTLPDGRNAHLIQCPPGWWLHKLKSRFQVLNTGIAGPGFWVIVARKARFAWLDDLFDRMGGGFRLLSRADMRALRKITFP